MPVFFIFLILPLFIIGLIVFLVVRFRKKEKDWYLRFFLSKEDAVSQFFFLFSVFFLGVTLSAFNKDLGEPLSWHTILLFTFAVGLGIAYYFKVIYTLAVSLIGLASWWGVQAIEWMEGKDIKTIVLFVGLSFIAILFYLIGRVYEKEMRFKRASMVYSILGLISVTGALFFLSTKSGLRILGEMTKGASSFASWEITFSILVFLISLVGIFLYAFSRKFIFRSEALAIGLLVVLFIVVVLLPEQTMFLQQRGYARGELSGTGILWAIIFNILIFLELAGIILLGYMKRENWLINLGAFFIFLLILVKYFDWFFTFMDKSAFFIGAGILLFVVGWFMEKGRRYMISAIKSK